LLPKNFSVDTLNLEDSDKETEEIIRNLVKRGYKDKEPDTSNVIKFRKKVVQLIGNFLLSNIKN
jgi:hypothetical protein